MLEFLYNKWIQNKYFNNIVFLSLFLVFGFLSFLQTEHLDPWNNYYNNKYSFYSILFLFLFLLSKVKYNIKLGIDSFLGLLLIFISFIQFFLGELYIQNFILQNLFLFLFLFFSTYVVNIDDYNKNFLLKFIFIFIFIVGFFSSIIAIIQYLDLDLRYDWVYNLESKRVYGNLGQPNQFATLMFLSILSIIFLNLKKINFTFLTIPIFVFVMYLTQSRMIVFFILLLTISTLIKIKYVNFRYLLSFVFICMTFFALYVIDLNTNLKDVHTASRLYELTNTGRITIWAEFLNYIDKTNVNFIGSGIGSIPSQSFFYGDGLSKEYYDSYHNIFMDFYVFFGLFGVLIIIYLFVVSIYSFLMQTKVEEIIGWICIFVILFHSLLEFPLYYGYFFILFFLFYFILIKNFYFFTSVNSKYIGVVFCLIFVFSHLFFCLYEKNKFYYRTIVKGGCTQIDEQVFFDKFNDLNYIVCARVDEVDLRKIEEKIKRNPDPNYVLKLISFYDYFENHDKFEFYKKLYEKKYGIIEEKDTID